jgi:hypothetical protein
MVVNLLLARALLSTAILPPPSTAPAKSAGVEKTIRAEHKRQNLIIGLVLIEKPPKKKDVTECVSLFHNLRVYDRTYITIVPEKSRGKPP